MDHIVNPLKTGVRNVAHTVKSVPGNLVDGVNMVSDKMTDSINKVFMNKVRQCEVFRPCPTLPSNDSI